MAKIVTFLDVGGKPTIHINVEHVLRIQDRVEPTEPVIIRLRGDSVNVGQDIEEVIEIVNSGETPDYDLDENGVLEGYLDPRYAGQRKQAAEAAERQRRAVQLAKAARLAEDEANEGFGAPNPEENPVETGITPKDGESEAEKGKAQKSKEEASEKVGFNELKAQKAASTAFGKHNK